MRNEPINAGSYSSIPQYFDYTVEGDISGLPGVYSPGDCSDVASAIGSFVGIVTFSIRDNIIPTTRVAVTSSFYEVTGFEITRQGYGFRLGDVFKPVGIVTDRRLNSPIHEFELTVIDVFNDGFSSWKFGQLDYIDSIKRLQNGVTTRFPLFYKGNLLSFEKNTSDADSERIDLSSILLIIINGVVQDPETNYVFNGGTSFSFTTPPRPEDQVSIFFYRGTRGVDSIFTLNTLTTFEVGDNIRLEKNDLLQNTVGQDYRTIYRIASSDTVETNLYTEQGIDVNNDRPITWTKQKVDKIIGGEYVSKTRDSIEPLVFPAAKVIKNFTSTDTEIFVDDSKFFEYEEDVLELTLNSFGAIIVNDKNNRVGKLSANVSPLGTISSLSIEDPGSGYIGTSVSVKISSPEHIGIGIGTVASAIVSITNGQLSTPIQIINPGYGYSNENLPNVIVPYPYSEVETIKDITTIEGFTGIVTGITTSNGVSGNSLAIKFMLRSNTPEFTGLTVGYPILVYNTNVGNGVTSIDTSENSIVGIGTTFLDNVYYVHQLNVGGNRAEVITNVKSNSNIIGILTTGDQNRPLGRFSWGRMSGFARSKNPISIGVTGLVVDSGLSSFPNIQRRQVGLRDSGGLEDKTS
jgi:hypothetical protein